MTVKYNNDTNYGPSVTSTEVMDEYTPDSYSDDFIGGKYLKLIAFPLLYLNIFKCRQFIHIPTYILQTLNFFKIYL